MDHICSVTHRFSRSTYVSGTLCKCHHRLQSLEEWGLSLLSQSSFIPWWRFYTWEDTMIDHFKKSSFKKEISPSLFPSLVASGKISGLIQNSAEASSVHHHCPEIITHFFWTFSVSFLMSSHWQIITLCVLDQIVNFSESGIILYLYFHPCIRNTEVKW